MIDSIFGFLAGSVTAGAGMYYYVMEEYKVANQLLSEDIYVRLPSLLQFYTLHPVIHRFLWGRLRTRPSIRRQGPRLYYRGRGSSLELAKGSEQLTFWERVS